MTTNASQIQIIAGNELRSVLFTKNHSESHAAIIFDAKSHENANDSSPAQVTSDWPITICLVSF